VNGKVTESTVRNYIQKSNKKRSTECLVGVDDQTLLNLMNILKYILNLNPIIEPII